MGMVIFYPHKDAQGNNTPPPPRVKKKKDIRMVNLIDIKSN
jgi:hypothetical protein